MVYGMVLVEHSLWSSQAQCDGIVGFAKKNGLKIDSWLTYSDTPYLECIKPGDTVVFYSWGCVGKTRPQLKKCISYFLENKIYFYSATSEYCAGAGCDFNQLATTFALYEDIRFNFISNKNIEAVNRRIARGISAGRHRGTKNKTHVWDPHKSEILQMYKSGASMYSIARKLNLTDPAVKRCLVANNIKVA